MKPCSCKMFGRWRLCGFLFDTTRSEYVLIPTERNLLVSPPSMVSGFAALGSCQRGSKRCFCRVFVLSFVFLGVAGAC